MVYKMTDYGGTGDAMSKTIAAKRNKKKPSSWYQTEGGKAGMAQAAKTAAGGGGVTDSVASGLIASGNPYAMGGGLALSTLGAIRKKRQARENQKAQMENQRRQRQVQALQSLVGTARGLSL